MAVIRKILVVDDSDDNREGICALLRFMSYDVREVSSGEQALAIAPEFKPDIFLVDVKMPRMTGLQLLERIKADDRRNEVIMMTGHESLDDACRAMELGAISYLRKPVRAEELSRYIEEAIAKIESRESDDKHREHLEREADSNARRAAENFRVAQFQSRRFDLILDNMHEPLVAVDGNGRIMMINRAAEKTFGITPGTAFDRPFDEVVPQKKLTGFINLLPAGQGPDDGCISGYAVETAGRLFAVSVSPLIQENASPAGYVMLFTDKTEQIRAQQLRNSILTVVSHEFKTPLSVLMNTASLLGMKKNCDDEVATVKNQIEEACGRLTYLVDTVATFAQLLREREDKSVRTAPTVVPTLLDRVKSKYLDAATDKEITVTVQPDDHQRSIDTNEDLLGIALGRLLDNAIKFSPVGGTVTLTCTTTTNDDGTYLHISVEDEGPGINPDNTNRLFDWFIQGADPLTRNINGLGMGLPLAKQAVSLISGTISLHTGSNGGCRAVVELPAG